MYNLSVARELLKQVYVKERLQPPTNFGVVRSAYSELWSRATNPTYWRGILNNGEWAKVSIYAVEAYGIFKVRLALVYRVPVIDPPADWRDCRSEKPCWIQRPVATALFISERHTITLILSLLHRYFIHATVS